jgi:hypothetical protein
MLKASAERIGEESQATMMESLITGDTGGKTFRKTVDKQGSRLLDSHQMVFGQAA